MNRPPYIFWFFVLFVSIVVGSLMGNAGWANVLDESGMEWVRLRFPRVVAAALVGALLGQAGVLSQGLMRNSLAAPTTLGVTSGAGVAAAFVIFMGWSNVWAIPAAAILGAAASLGVMLLCANRGLGLPQVLLLGVALSAVFSSVAGLLSKVMLHDVVRISRLYYWGMGDLASITTQACMALCLIFILHSLLASKFFQGLNLLAVGEKFAISQGVSLGFLQTGILALVALSVGSVVATAGSVSFIGLMVPHISRVFFGNLSDRLFWGSSFVGASLMVWIDIFCRVILSGEELPLGVVTALFGGGFFFLLVLRGRISGSSV